jgi:hypothetical protein
MDICVVLGCRDDAVGFDYLAVIIYFHVVVEDASWCSNGTDGGPGFELVVGLNVAEVIVVVKRRSLEF